MSREREHVPDWEHLLFASLLLAFIVWYLWTSAAASFTFSNLILIGPVGAIAAVLLLYIASIEIFGRATAATAQSTSTEPSAGAAHGRFRSGSLATIAALMGLFGAFVVAIPYVGFDVATFLFVGATLWLLGERQIVVLLSLALGIAVALSLAALTLLTFPMPMAGARAVWGSL
jgi:putative tricarboxylic transport membrane protein